MTSQGAFATNVSTALLCAFCPLMISKTDYMTHTDTYHPPMHCKYCLDYTTRHNHEFLKHLSSVHLDFHAQSKVQTSIASRLRWSRRSLPIESWVVMHRLKARDISATPIKTHRREISLQLIPQTIEEIHSPLFTLRNQSVLKLELMIESETQTQVCCAIM